MDIMTDDELLAVIGHEIDHVKNEDTKDAIKSAYLKAAALEAGSAATLNESQVGKMANEFYTVKNKNLRQILIHMIL